MKKLLAGVVVLGSLLVVVSSGIANESGNIIKNGDFEEKPDYVLKTEKRAHTLIEKGWDLGEGPMALRIPGWKCNRSGGVAKVRLVEGVPGKEVHSGKRCLMMSGQGAPIYNLSHGKANCKYSVSFYARGKGEIRASIYQYGAGGGFLSTDHLLLEKVSDGWEKYERVFKTTDLDAKSFMLSLIIYGEIYIDDVVMYEEGSETTSFL